MPFFRSLGIEDFEGVIVNQLVDDGFSFIGVGNKFDNFFSYFFEFLYEPAVRIGEEVFEFLSCVCGVCGAVAIGSDCYLQGASVEDGGDVEVAKVRLVNDVAEYFEGLAVGVNPAIERSVVGGGDDEQGADEIVLGVAAYDEFDVGLFAFCLEGFVDVVGDDDDPCSDVAECADLS